MASFEKLLQELKAIYLSSWEGFFEDAKIKGPIITNERVLSLAENTFNQSVAVSPDGKRVISTNKVVVFDDEEHWCEFKREDFRTEKIYLDDLGRIGASGQGEDINFLIGFAKNSGIGQLLIRDMFFADDKATFLSHKRYCPPSIISRFESAGAAIGKKIEFRWVIQKTNIVQRLFEKVRSFFKEDW